MNRKDPACDANEKLESEVTAQTAFLTPEILAIPSEQLRAFFTGEPRLTTYRFAIEDIRRNAPHTLPEDQQALLDGLQPEIGDWQYDLYEQILAGIPFGTVRTAGGALDLIRQRSLLASSPEARGREEAFKRRYNGFASQRDLLAFALIHTVRAQNSLAKAHHYQDAPARQYSNMYLDPAQTRALLNSMAQHGGVAERFEQIRAHDFQEAYKAPMQAWDLSAPQPGFDPPIVPLADAPSMFHNAFAGLGTEYQEAFDAVLDARNGRADVIPGGSPNRYAGGFSVGFPGSTSILFFGRFYGGLLALKYYQLYAANRAEFVPRYIALLKNGFDAPPAELLKRFLNVDLFDQSLLADDLDLLNRGMSQLERAQ